MLVVSNNLLQNGVAKKTLLIFNVYIIDHSLEFE
jgi:hypothetical protein